jgi:hypothetical protein
MSKSSLRQQGLQRKVREIREELAMIERGSRHDPDFNERVRGARTELGEAIRLAAQDLAEEAA